MCLLEFAPLFVATFSIRPISIRYFIILVLAKSLTNTNSNFRMFFYRFVCLFGFSSFTFILACNRLLRSLSFTFVSIESFWIIYLVLVQFACPSEPKERTIHVQSTSPQKKQPSSHVVVGHDIYFLSQTILLSTCGRFILNVTWSARCFWSRIRFFKSPFKKQAQQKVWEFAFFFLIFRFSVC